MYLIKQIEYLKQYWARESMKAYSDLKDLELLSESALESSLAGYWDWDILNNEEYLSPRFKEMFGYKDCEMENKPEAWQKIAFPEDLPAMFDAFQKHIESKGEMPFKSVVRYHHKDGRTIWVRCNGKVVEWTEEGAPVRAIGCHVDITEEKEIEEKLKKAIAEKDILLSEVHHRVKNNLQLIQSLARLKQKERKVDLHEIEDSISAIAAAHEALYRSERFDKIDLTKYLQRVIAPLLISQEIHFEIQSDQISEKINFLIQIGLIITECVNNSLKHGFYPSIEQKKITITIQKTAEEIIIIYEDNGSGYKSSVLESVNEITSFGITLMTSLAEQINGKIHLANHNGAQMKLTIDTHKNETTPR